MVEKETELPLNFPHCFGLTDIGKHRSSNEDQFLIAQLHKSMTIHQTTLPLKDDTRLQSGVQGQLLLVADGFGGGDIASKLSVQTIADHVLNTMPWFFKLQHDLDHDEDQLRAELVETLKRCETVVEREIEQHPDQKGIGTTLTMAYIVWPHMYVVHAGDSRCYVFRDNELLRMTRDQTLGQNLIDAGKMTAEQAYDAHLTRVLVSAIGDGMERLQPEVNRVELAMNDKILLCTDGLTNEISEASIAEVMGSAGTEEWMCRQLTSLANDAGGRDNCTVVISRISVS